MHWNDAAISEPIIYPILLLLSPVRASQFYWSKLYKNHPRMSTKPKENQGISINKTDSVIDDPPAIGRQMVAEWERNQVNEPQKRTLAVSEGRSRIDLC